MQTKNTAVVALEAVINAAPAWADDRINDLLSDYPAVWDELFDGGTDVDDAELTEQATAAAAAVADLIAELS